MPFCWIRWGADSKPVPRLCTSTTPGKLYSLRIQLSSCSSIYAHNLWHWTLFPRYHVTHHWWSQQHYHLLQGHWHPHLSSSSVLTSKRLQKRSSSQSTLVTSPSVFWRLRFSGIGRWNGVILWTTWILPCLFTERSPCHPTVRPGWCTKQSQSL